MSWENIFRTWMFSTTETRLGIFNRAPGRISSKKRTEISVENARMMSFTVGAKTFAAVRLLV